MNPLRRLIRKIGRSDLYGFNLHNRDAWVLDQAKQVPAGSTVLDAGAGSSPYRSAFAHCEYKTQDFGKLSEEQLRDTGYGQIDIVGDIANMPVDNASFDAVLCTEVLEHHAEPIKVVHELARVLRPGGKLILTAPLGSGIHQEPHHYYGGYTPFWYNKFLVEAGFENIQIEANAGSLRHLSQEGIRFMQMTRPLGAMLPTVPSLLFAPVWLLLAPVFLFILPVTAKLLDGFDQEQRFTVGYHVIATRKND